MIRADFAQCVSQPHPDFLSFCSVMPNGGAYTQSTHIIIFASLFEPRGNRTPSMAVCMFRLIDIIYTFGEQRECA